MFIDTHAHIYESDYADDLDLVIARAKEAGAQKIFLPPTNEASTRKALKVAERYPNFCHAMIGLHPEDVKEDYSSQLDKLENLLLIDRQKPQPQFIAIGEVGLDYYWDRTYRDQQVAAFSRQTEWAATHHLPLMIHSRSANGDLLGTLKPWRQKLDSGGVFHCFSGSIETAQELLRFHPKFYLGIGGVATFKKSRLPEVIKAIPLERIVLETDSPYMAPTPMRGKRNEPSYVPYIIQTIAQAKGVPTEEVGRITTQNAMQLFFPN